MTPEQIAKQPKYVRDYIFSLERERANAVREMRRLEAAQEPTKVWTEDFENYGESKGCAIVRRYFACDRLEIESGGVRLSVGGLWNDEGIQLSWRPDGPGHPLGDVLFIPTAYQQAKLVALENGRT